MAALSKINFTKFKLNLCETLLAETKRKMQWRQKRFLEVGSNFSDVNNLTLLDYSRMGNVEFPNN